MIHPQRPHTKRGGAQLFPPFWCWLPAGVTRVVGLGVWADVSLSVCLSVSSVMMLRRSDGLHSAILDGAPIKQVESYYNDQMLTADRESQITAEPSSQQLWLAAEAPVLKNEVDCEIEVARCSCHCRSNASNRKPSIETFNLAATQIFPCFRDNVLP